ncbi:MAG: hypothetical protein V1699_06175 [Candidatus Omnitrophota bacterium]
MRSAESIYYLRNFFLRYKNYIAVLIASLCIWKWYWASNFIGMHDTWDAMHYVKTSYESWRGGLIPLWQTFGGYKRYFFAGGEYPVLPLFSFFLTHVLSLPAWLKTHYYIYLLFGAIGMVTLLEKLQSRGFLPAFFALVSFFSGRIQAFIYYQYTWVVMWAFMPWMLYFLIKSNDDWRYWLGIAITVALFIFSAPAHAFTWAAGSIIIFSLCYILRDKTVFFRTILGLLAGMLLSAPVLLPMLTYNWAGTIGRITNPTHGYFDLHQLITSFIGRFSQHINVYFLGPKVLMWHESYSYIGIIPVFLILAGLGVAIFRFRKWYLQCSIALYSFLIAFAILLISCGNIIRIMDYLYIPFAGTSPFPQRMTVAVIFWSSVGASTALSALWDNLNLNARRILAGLTLAALIFITVDYTMLLRQIDQELHGSTKAKKMAVEDLNNSEWLSKNELEFAGDNKDAKLGIELLVPGNGLYFIGNCDKETAIWFPNLDNRFVERYLRIRNVSGKEVRKENYKFILPAGEYCYRLYLKDIYIYIGILVSFATIVLLVLMRDRFAKFLKPKGISGF